MKRLISLLALAFFVAGAAHAADGKVVSVAEGVAVVDVGADTDFKAGAKVRINGKNGTVTAVEGSKVTIKSSSADALKAGDTVKVTKAKALQGC